MLIGSSISNIIAESTVYTIGKNSGLVSATSITLTQPMVDAGGFITEYVATVMNITNYDATSFYVVKADNGIITNQSGAQFTFTGTGTVADLPGAITVYRFKEGSIGSKLTHPITVQNSAPDDDIVNADFAGNELLNDGFTY